MGEQLTRKYFADVDSNRQEWCVTGEFGSLSFWYVKYPDDYKYSYGESGYGGVEAHYNEKSKPEYLSDSSKHDDCRCNEGVCFHDGTSLWASEYWIPNVLPYGDDEIFNALERNYNLNKKDDE